MRRVALLCCLVCFFAFATHAAFDDCLVPSNQNTYEYMDCGIGVPAADESTGAVFHVRGYSSGALGIITKLQPSNLTVGDQFGCSISIDTHLENQGFAVGACGDGSLGRNAGAVYLCGLTGSWTECQAKYLGNASFPTTNAQFGTQVSMVGGDMVATSLFGYVKMFVWPNFNDPTNVVTEQTFTTENFEAGGVNDEGWVMCGDIAADAVYFLGESTSDPSGLYSVQQKINGPTGSSFGAFMRNSYPEATSLVGAPDKEPNGSVFVLESTSTCTSECDCQDSTAFFCFQNSYEIPAPPGAYGQFGQHLLPSQAGLWGVSSLGAVYHVEKNPQGQLQVMGNITVDYTDRMAYFVGFRPAPTGLLFGMVRQYMDDGSLKLYLAQQQNSRSDWNVVSSLVIPTGN